MPLRARLARRRRAGWRSSAPSRPKNVRPGDLHGRAAGAAARARRGCRPWCAVGVVALADPADELAYADQIVEYDLRYDLDMPSPAMLDAVHFIHKAGYSHVVIQQARTRAPLRVLGWIIERVNVPGHALQCSGRCTPPCSTASALRPTAAIVMCQDSVFRKFQRYSQDMPPAGFLAERGTRLCGGVRVACMRMPSHTVGQEGYA